MDLQTFLWLFVSLFASLSLIVYGVPKIIEVANLKKLFDDFEDERKIHDDYTPNIGGIVIIMTFVIAYSIHPAAGNLLGYEYIIAASVILLAVGLKDDLFMIAASKKFLGQVIVSTIVIFGAGLQIQNLGGLFGIYEIPYAFSIALTYFLFIGLINAINLIDGIDGLAASVTVIASLLFGYWFYISGHEALFVFSVILAGCYGFFLFYNWAPAKVFMGDTGALFSGFYLAILSVHFLNSGITGVTIAGWQSSMAVVLLAILILPVYDTARVVILRLFSGKSPFKADLIHIHHQFLDMGLSHAKTTSILVLINLGIVGFTILMAPTLSVNLLFVCVILLCIITLPTVWLKRNIIFTLRSLLQKSEKRSVPSQKVHLNSGSNDHAELSHKNDVVFSGSIKTDNKISKRKVVSAEREKSSLYRD